MSEPNFEASEPIGAPITTGARPAAPRKQTFNIYTVMLIIAFFCLLIGTIFLYLELSKYGDITDSPWRTESGRPRQVFNMLQQVFRA